MLQTTIAGSLPKPRWLAEPERLWAPWKMAGAELRQAKLDATILAVKLQEDAGIDIVGDGEQYLKVNTPEPERENRRVTIRRITPLLNQEAAR